MIIKPKYKKMLIPMAVLLTACIIGYIKDIMWLKGISIVLMIITIKGVIDNG